MNEDFRILAKRATRGTRAKAPRDPSRSKQPVTQWVFMRESVVKIRAVSSSPARFDRLTERTTPVAGSFPPSRRNKET